MVLKMLVKKIAYGNKLRHVSSAHSMLISHYFTAKIKVCIQIFLFNKYLTNIQFKHNIYIRFLDIYVK